MKILAWILLVMGVLLILAAIIIFLKFGGREACENLRKTKKLQKNDEDKELADEMFYKDKRSYSINEENKNVFNNDKEPFKKRRIEFGRTLARDDTALLAQDMKLEDISFDEEQYYHDPDNDETEELIYETYDDDTEPLIFAEDMTEVLQK